MMPKRYAAMFFALLVAIGVGFIASSATSTAATRRTYPLHTGIVSTTFWVGETFDGTAADGSQVCSTYDSQWARRWSDKSNGTMAGAGTDCSGAAVGGCDGKPLGTGALFKCGTERRTLTNGYFPTSPLVAPKENPFYLDLPFDDLNNSTAFRSRSGVVPWASDAGYTGNATNKNFSYMKNRWVKLIRNGRVCYGQIQDAGPGQYNDQAYVFGKDNSRPRNRQYGRAGMDVSPALTGCLGFDDLDGITGGVAWSFVENTDVPAGPWTRVITTSQVDGTAPSATYEKSIIPPHPIASDKPAAITSPLSVTPAVGIDSVKAIDSANTVSDRTWFFRRKAEGVELYVMHSTLWGSCTPWSRSQAQLKMALDAGMKIAIYTRNPHCWSSGIDAAGPYVSKLQFFALDVETDPGLPVTREMVDGVKSKGVRPVIYSGSGMWPSVMGYGNADFSDVPLWDTNANLLEYPGWRAKLDTPTPVAYGGWNTTANPRVLVQQAFEVTVDGVKVDLNSVRADFLR